MKPTLLSGAVLGAASLASAQQASAQTQLPEPMVVTATRGPQPLTDTLAAASVIDRADIELSQAQDLLELIRLQAGVDMVRTGGPGGQTSLFMRGTNSNHVLVLIDGVRVAATNTGGFQWENLPLAEIERIEIIRGPRASYYGSDAIGGVVQIFTRREDGATVRAGYGSDNNRQASASAGRRGVDGSLSISASWRETDGFSAQNPSGFSFDPDDDGFRNLGLNLNGSYRLGPGELHISGLIADGETEFDQGVADTGNQAAQIGYRFELGDAWSHRLEAGYSHNGLENDFGGFGTRFDSSRVQFSWLSRWQAGPDLEVLGGVDAYEEYGENEGSFDRERYDIGAFTGIDWRPGRHEVSASLRVDDDELFGSELTGQAAYGYNFGRGFKAIASFGSAFRAPSFSQLFSPGLGGQFAGNPDLEPEESDSYELGLRFDRGAHRLSLSGYRTELDNLIEFAGENFRAVNVNEAEIAGGELDYQWQHPRWRGGATLTIQEAENEDTGGDLLRRPDTKASITLDRSFTGGGSLGVEVFYNGEREDIGGVTLDDYTLLNLRARWPIIDGLRVEGRLENLLDKDYQPAAGFNAQDLAGFVHLRWHTE